MAESEIQKVLRNRKLKATGHRLALLEAIQKYKSAMPYSEIQRAMKSMDRVTLYRNLENLTRNGVIHKAFQESNEVYYAICGSGCSSVQHNHEHVHFKCVQCEEVTCEQITKKVNFSIPHHKISSVSIHLEGYCKNCC